MRQMGGDIPPTTHEAARGANPRAGCWYRLLAVDFALFATMSSLICKLLTIPVETAG